MFFPKLDPIKEPPRQPIHEIPLAKFAIDYVVPEPLPRGLQQMVEDTRDALTGLTPAQVAATFPRKLDLMDGFFVRTKPAEKTSVQPGENVDERFAARDYAIVDGTDKVVGGYAFYCSYVDPAYRGRGLTAAAIQLLWDDPGCSRYLGTVTCFSPAGRAARVRAHRDAVTKALEAGLNIPDDVRADYPDLTAPAPSFA